MFDITYHTSTISLSFVIVLYKCRHRNTEFMRLFDSLHAPESFEIIDAVRTQAPTPLRPFDENTVDDWGFTQVSEMARLWPRARVCIAITTALSSRAHNGARYAIDSAFGLSGSTFKDMILNRGSVTKMLDNKRVPHPNMQREVNERLVAFVREMLTIYKNEHSTT